MPQQSSPHHHAWKGAAAGENARYVRAARLFPIRPGQVCAECEVRAAQHRHHWDRDTLNNTPTNVVFLCARCHWRIHDPRQR